MSGPAHLVGDRHFRSIATARALPLEEALRAAVPPLLFGLRLWASVSLALYAAFWLQLDNPFWAGASAAIVCQPQLGASLRKGWFRMLGTLIGAVMSIVLTACFAQDRVLFLGALALWGAGCAFVAVLLRNFASYAASLAGYTAAIVAGELLGSVGGVDANAAFLLAVTRATEICLGIVCAGVVLAATDLGGARRRLATLFADLAVGITAGLARTLAMAGGKLRETQAVQREFVRRIIALDPIVDQALGKSSGVRYHSSVLQRVVDDLFSALAGWHAVSDHLAALPANEARQQAATILEKLPEDLQSGASEAGTAAPLATPAMLHRVCQTARRRLTALPAETPSLQLLADKTAGAFTGVGQALNGIAFLVADPAGPALPGARHALRVPDWLPPLVSAGRTFATIGAVSLFWIVTAWPGGALAMTFAAIVALLLAPRSDEAYGAALLFTVGAILDLFLTAVVAFAVLPGLRPGATHRRLCRLEPRYRRLSGTHRRSASACPATLAGRPVHRDDNGLRANPPTDQPGDLRYPTLLQHRVGDRCRHGRCSPFVPYLAALVARVPHAPAVGADLARSAPVGKRTDAKRLGGPCHC